MDEVFKALADPTRRSLLDELFKNDGQTLTQLEERLPMTRFGVMKHLKLLEEAHLVVTRRRGREKLHFLNVIPIRLLHDRWINKYTEPWASSLTHLKHTMENRTMEKIYEIYIKTTPERLWHAITDPVARAKYNFGVLVTSDWTKGSHFEGKGGGRAQRDRNSQANASRRAHLWQPRENRSQLRTPRCHHTTAPAALPSSQEMR